MHHVSEFCSCDGVTGLDRLSPIEGPRVLPITYEVEFYLQALLQPPGAVNSKEDILPIRLL
jgi:hypothetical protein